MNLRRALASLVFPPEIVRLAFDEQPKPASGKPIRRMSYEEFVALLPGKEPDPYRRKLERVELPTVPFKVERTKEMREQMAMDDSGNFPGALNFLNSIAGASYFGLYFPGYPFLAEISQRSEYRQPTETTAKEMTRKWVSFKSKGESKKDDEIKELEDEVERVRLQAVFRKATEHDGFYGLGHVFIDIKGQDDHALPLTIADDGGIGQGKLLGFKNIEPMWATPLVWNATDPTRPNFYRPTDWMILGRKTSQSRMLRFVSREVPDIIKPAYNFGGLSLSQLIQPYVDRWLRTVDGVNRLINNFSIINLQTDMSAILAGGPSTELLKRMKLFTQTRDNQAAFLSDKEAELLSQLAVPLSGLSELQAQAQEHMAAPTHLPLVVLTGITPSGLNASSDSEIEIFHDWINSMQEDLYTDQLKTAIHACMLNLWGKVDMDITWDFVPLKQLTGEALSRVKKTQSEMDQTYVDVGAVDPMEVREKIARDPDSGYNNLSITPPPELKEKNDAATELALSGGEPPDADDDETRNAA